MVGLPVGGASMEWCTIVGIDQEGLGVSGGGHLVGIHRQRIHVAYMAGDASEVAIGIVRLVFCGVRAKVDLGGI